MATKILLDIPDNFKAAGFSNESIHDAFDLSEAEGESLGPLYPASALGMAKWGFRVRAVADTTKNPVRNTHGVCGLVLPDNTVVTIASGTRGTGDPKGSPMTVSEKGPGFAAVVESTQLPLAFMASSNKGKRYNFWIILHRFDPTTGIMSLELSRPNGVTEAQQISSWSERCPLPDLVITPPPAGKRGIDDDRIDDVPVRLKPRG